MPIQAGFNPISLLARAWAMNTLGKIVVSVTVPLALVLVAFMLLFGTHTAIKAVDSSAAGITVLKPLVALPLFGSIAATAIVTLLCLLGTLVFLDIQNRANSDATTELTPPLPGKVTLTIPGVSTQGNLWISTVSLEPNPNTPAVKPPDIQNCHISVVLHDKAHGDDQARDVSSLLRVATMPGGDFDDDTQLFTLTAGGSPLSVRFMSQDELGITRIGRAQVLKGHSYIVTVSAWRTNERLARSLSHVQIDQNNTITVSEL